MKTIKFKAWDSIRKEMLYDVQLGHDFGCWQPFGFFINNPDYTLMQFTGLKDSDGVEIYEGDMVRIDGKRFYGQANEDYSLHRVIWDDVECSFYLIGIDVMIEDTGKPSRNMLNERWVKGKLADCYKLSVVGNIYENPQLLKTT